MDIKLVVSDGKRIERVGRILLVLIARHRRACRALEEVVKRREVVTVRVPPTQQWLEWSGKRDTLCWLSELRQ